MPTYTSSIIAHAWIHKQTEAGQCANASFAGDNFYSFSTLIAHRRRNKKEEEAIFLDTYQYSVTTAKHQSAVLSAASHLLLVTYDSDVINARPDEINAKGLAKYYRQGIEDKIDEARRSKRYYNSLLNEARDMAVKLNAVLDWFGSKLPRYDLAALEVRLREVFDEKSKPTNGKSPEESDQEGLQKWFAGKRKTVPERLRYGNKAYLRLHPEQPSVVQTSKNVLFSVEEAKLLYKLWNQGVILEGISANQIKIGGYMLNKLIPGDCIIVGCHTVFAEEIERFATVLGLSISDVA